MTAPAYAPAPGRIAVLMSRSILSDEGARRRVIERQRERFREAGYFGPIRWRWTRCRLSGGLALVGYPR